METTRLNGASAQCGTGLVEAAPAVWEPNGSSWRARAHPWAARGANAPSGDDDVRYRAATTMSATSDDDVRYHQLAQRVQAVELPSTVLPISVMPAPARAPEAHGVHRGDLERNILDRGALERPSGT